MLFPSGFGKVDHFATISKDGARDRKADDISSQDEVFDPKADWSAQWAKGKNTKLGKTIMEAKRQYLDTLGLKLTRTESIDGYFDTVKQGRECPNCRDGTNNGLYCFKCLVPLQRVSLPKVPKLPLKLWVIRHKREPRKKSSAVHAEVLCGKEYAQTVETPLANDLAFDKETCCVLFPSETSVPIRDLPNLKSLKSVVVLDSTWSQAPSMNHLKQLEDIPRVHLKEYKTLFWRHQSFPDTHLATIEAMYYFFVEYEKAVHDGFYDGKFDDMLSIFVGQFRKIERSKSTKGSCTTNDRPDPTCL